jgi:phycocyanobilin lyase beta subunit
MDQSIKKLIQAIEQANSADGLLEAVKTLVATRNEAAIPTLIKVLGCNNPGAAVAAVDGLIEFGEVSVPYILDQLDSYNYGARAWATRALAGVGDPRGLELLLEAASNDFALSVRRAAAKGLGNILWEKLPLQEVILQQQRVLETLILVTKDPEWIVRYSAVTGLQFLAIAMEKTQPHYLEKIAENLQQIITTDEELIVRVRGKLALQVIDN